MKYKILIVDDEPANLRLLERLFRRSYQVISATSGEEALTFLELHDIALIVSDQRMPGMTGIEFLKRASEMRPKTVRIILTGYTDVNDLVDAINSGVVYKYITKPWVNEDLQLTVVRALEYFETYKDRHDLAQQNTRLTNELAATTKGFVHLISETLQAQGANNAETCERVANNARALALWLELDEPRLEELSYAAALCGLAQLEIRDANTQIPLQSSSGSEADSTSHWAAILEDIPGMEEVASALRFQNANFDGTESFDHLSGEQLPLYARILSIACAFDSWVFPADGQDAATQEEAFQKLRSGAGTRFDPNLVDAFCVAAAVGPIRSEPLRDPGNAYLQRVSRQGSRL